MKIQELPTADFELVSRWDGLDEETLAAIKEDLADLDNGGGGIDCKRIIIPSGSSKAFTVETDDPDSPDSLKVIEGVILFHHRMNVYWETAFGEGDNKAPTCSSMNGEIGVWTESGEVRSCDAKDCPYNNYAETKDGYMKKACRNIRRIYLVMSGKPYIYLLAVPPTSVKEVSKALAQAVKVGRRPISQLVMQFKLYSATNKKGTTYNKVSVEPVGVLKSDLLPKLGSMKSDIKLAHDSVTISAADYMLTDGGQSAAALPAHGAVDAGAMTSVYTSDGFSEVESVNEDTLPF